MTHSALEKGSCGKTSYPCEVFQNKELQVEDMLSTFIKIDKGEIPLPVFLHQMNEEEYDKAVIFNNEQKELLKEE